MEECIFENKHFKDLNARSVGHECCVPGHSCGPETRDHYLIHYIISGEGFLRMNHKTYRITAGNMFIIPPNTLFYFQADSENPWEYTWICFDGECAANLDKLKSPVLQIDGSCFENLLECRSYAGMEAEYLISRIWIIFSHIFRQKKYDYVSIARDYMTMNYMRKINIEYLADNIGINRKYLARIFKEATGISMREFLVDLRMNKARGFIINQRYSIATAASMVGYDDPFAFSRQFKKHFGHPPSYYTGFFSDNNL